VQNIDHKAPMICVSAAGTDLLVIFTKDRPDRLRRILPGLAFPTENVILLDDSHRNENRLENIQLAEMFNLNYHGKYEQQSVLGRLLLPDLQNFVGALGSVPWGLGFNRNYALVLASLQKATKLIMMDDDVDLEGSPVATDVLRLLDANRFVGAKIEQMPDDSIVGHIHRGAHVVQKRYASGTFLGLQIDRPPVNFFVNHYNEDWIWLFLENYGRPVFSPVSVKQLVFNPFVNWKDKVLFQEYGEILWEGVTAASERGQFSLLENCDHWRIVISDRRQDIDAIGSMELPGHILPIAHGVRSHLLNYLDKATCEPFVRFWKEYLELLPIWHRVMEHLCSQGWSE
jgi:hypothetical protein